MGFRPAISIPGFNLASIDRDLARLGAAIRPLQSSLNSDIDAQIAQLRQLFNVALRATAPNATARTSVGQLGTDVSHGVALRNGERAFTLLNGTRGAQDYYQRLTAERALNTNEALRDIRQEFRNAPAVRRARM